MRTSTIPATLDGLKDALQDKAELAGVGVSTAPLGDDSKKEQIAFTNVEMDQDWGPYGRKSKDENYTVNGEIWIEKQGGGEDKARESRERAFELLAVVEETLLEDPTLNGLLIYAHLAGANLDQGMGDRVRYSLVRFRVQVRARLTEVD